MRAELARIYIKRLLDSLDTFENEYDKIKTGQLLCDLVLHSDIMYSQYGEYDKEFNDYFGQMVRKLYTLYPDQFEKTMHDYEQFEDDVIYSGSEETIEEYDTEES